MHRAAPIAPAAELGTVAHAALEEWIRNAEWREVDSGDRLATRFRDLAPPDEGLIGEVRQINSRLRVRGAQLGSFLQSEGFSLVEPEVFLSDESQMIRGKLDIVAHGQDRITVLDFKTGGGYQPGQPLPESATAQLAIYEELVRQRWNMPTRSGIFSLQQGLLWSGSPAQTVVQSLLTIRDEIEAGNHPASPDERHCMWCTARMDCEEQWAAAESTDWGDCVTGRVVRIDQGTMGLHAVLIEGPAGETLVCGATTLWPTPSPGDTVAVIGVWRDHEDPRVRRATPRTEFRRLA